MNMQIKVITDKTDWESFIEKNAPQSFFQSWDWGEITKKSSDAKISFIDRFGIYEGKVLLGIFQLQKVHARRGSFLQIRHGPILSDYNSKILKFITDYLISFSKIEKSSFIRISPLLFPDKSKIQLFRSVGFNYSPLHRLDGEYCWVLDLDKNEDELLQNMRKTTRYLIRWGLKNGVIIKKSSNPSNLNRFLKLYKHTAKRHHFVEHKGITEEFEILVKNNNAQLFEGYYKNKLLTSALIIFYQNQAIYHHSASIEQKIPVNYLLQWEVILEAKKRGAKVYNFWGISTPGDKRHPWKNLTQFKMGFGGRVLEYLHSMDLPVNRFLYLRTYLIEYLRKLLKGY